MPYTAREVRSGLLFWAFAQRRSAAVSAVFAARIQQHLGRCGISLRDLAWQTDNGVEFIGSYDRRGRRTGFPAALGDSQHLRIPPAAHTYQSDVETVHRLVEDEFFDLEAFTRGGDFLAKALTYQLYFNLVRPNSHKENQSPWQIIERLAPRSPLELCLLPPVFLDYYLNDSGGYDVGRLPYVGSFEQRNDAATGPGFRREGLALQIDVEGQAFDGRVQLLMGLLLSRLEIGDLRPKRRKLGFLSGQLFGVLLSEGFFLLRALERLHVFAQPLLVFEDAANVSLF